MFSTLKRTIMARLRRGKAARDRFVESHLSKTIAYQIRALRDREELSQSALAEKIGMNQNAISRLESAHYGKYTLTTLKRLASCFDVALIVRFVPYSELADWASGTSYVNPGLTSQALAVPSFEDEEKQGAFQGSTGIIESVIAATVGAYPMNIPLVQVSEGLSVSFTGREVGSGPYLGELSSELGVRTPAYQAYQLSA
jgi:transcriptional regulator with XRE-family HTH domain